MAIGSVDSDIVLQARFGYEKTVGRGLVSRRFVIFGSFEAAGVNPRPTQPPFRYSFAVRDGGSKPPPYAQAWGIVLWQSPAEIKESPPVCPVGIRYWVKS